MIQPRNLLIIKLSAIGDVVMASPVIPVFRSVWPDARISWLVEEVSAGLIEDNPRLDEVIVWPKSVWKKTAREGGYGALLKEVRRFATVLRSRRFDCVFDLQGFLKSGILARVTGAPVRIGLDSSEGSSLLMTKVIPWDRSEKRIGVQYMQFVRGLGLDPGSFEMDLLIDREQGFVRDFVHRKGLSRGYAALIPFASNPQKRWPEVRWAVLADRLSESSGLGSVLLGGPGDVPAADRILSVAKSPIVSTTGEATLKQSAALVAGASVVVGGDTGLTHMGIGFNVPTVALFGPTYPYRQTGRQNTVLLSRNLSCAPCRRDPTCDGHYDCMTGIEAQEVFDAATGLLKGGAGL